MEQMKALYTILNDEDSDYGYGARWKTRHVIDPETKRWVDIEDDRYDTFEVDGINFWWYHAKNQDGKHPVLVASWSVQKAVDDFNEYEEEIDADIESIIGLVKNVNSGHYYE